MIDAAGATHTILHKDPHAYCAHPQIAVAANGDWLVVFNRAPRRPVILHPPQDPEFRNVIIRSSDRGSTWSSPQVAPNYDWSGTECASLTPLSDGRLMLNQWRFRWFPLGFARRSAGESPGGGPLGPLRFPADLVREFALSPELESAKAMLADPEAQMPWARGDGQTWVHFSEDNGQSWAASHLIETAPYAGGYGMRGACQLPNGHLLLPLSDIPNYRTVFVVRSTDVGHDWGKPVRVAAKAGSEFEEASLIRLPSGRLLMHLRDNGTRRLHQCVSDDDGHGWSEPQPLPIEGYPPHLLSLPDGRILCTVGWRFPDFGIRAVLSADGGESWNIDGTIRIRGGLPNKDLGYPCTLLDDDGSLFTVYYGQDADGVTGIWATRWRL
jgi:hypothetical protein